MKVVMAQTAGFCWGVKRAVERAQALARERQGAVYTDGPLIHNEEMLAQLQTEGIREVADPATLRRGDILVVRAHGIPPERQEALRRLPITVVNATCPDVARTQGLIKKHANQGYHTLILGDGGHAEVVALLGYAQGRGHVVHGPENVASLPELTLVCLAAQSTQFPDDYARVAEAVVRRYPDAVVLDTICAATKSRQSALTDLAREVDALVVVGGKQSANTRRLAELAAGLRPTFHIQTSAEIDPAAMKSFATVGLTAGASTPDFVIQEVKAVLESI